MLCTSTFPGPMYAKPLLLAILSFCPRLNLFSRLESCSAGFRHCVVLIAGPAADSNCTHDLPVLLKGNAACENHDTPIVGRVNPEKLTARLAVRREILCGNIERTRRVSLLLRNINAADPSPVHTDVGHKISA